MLVAEKHGKVLAEAQNHEDYLTSSVFGHLRYVPPQEFWDALFGRAIASTPEETQFTKVIPNAINEYEKLEAMFWRMSQKHGEPDLILRFSRDDMPSLIVIIEVKLSSDKSGVGENDQLVKYMRLLDELPSIDIKTNPDDLRFLIYLTPRNSLNEINDSLNSCECPSEFRDRILRLQWQDVLEVARSESKRCSEPSATILSDVADFLCKRGLEYFDGFREHLDFSPDECDGSFYASTSRVAESFSGFELLDSFQSFEVQHGGWVND
jgi:hypothetical protein